MSGDCGREEVVVRVRMMRFGIVRWIFCCQWESRGSGCGHSGYVWDTGRGEWNRSGLRRVVRGICQGDGGSLEESESGMNWEGGVRGLGLCLVMVSCDRCPRRVLGGVEWSVFLWEGGRSVS